MTEYIPQSHDLELLTQFTRRALHKGNVESALRPPAGYDKAAFADVLIGSYVKQAEDERRSIEVPKADTRAKYERKLAKAALAVALLSGTASYETLEQLAEESRHEKTRQSPLTYNKIKSAALSVASEGGKYLRHFAENTTPYSSRGEKTDDAIIEAVEMPIVEEVESLDLTIRQLPENGPVSKGKAIAFLLLFEMVSVNADSETIAHLKKQARVEIAGRLRGIKYNAHYVRGEEFIDPRMALGVKYLGEIVNNEMAGDIESIAAGAMLSDKYIPSADRAVQHVESHIAHVLNVLYTSR